MVMEVFVTNHAAQRFQERFDNSLNLIEAKDLLKDAVYESKPLGKKRKLRLRQVGQYSACYWYRYHHHAGLILVLEPQAGFVRLITCWVDI